MSRIGNRWVAVAVVFALGCLYGCSELTQVTTGRPLAIQRDGVDLIVVMCDDVEVSGVTMQEREYPGSWTTFWEFEKMLTLRSGERLALSQADAIGVEPGHEPDMTANHELGIYFHVDQPGGDLQDELGATFLIGEHGLSETVWLRDDGSETSSACPPRK